MGRCQETASCRTHTTTALVPKWTTPGITTAFLAAELIPLHICSSCPGVAFTQIWRPHHVCINCFQSYTWPRLCSS